MSSETPYTETELLLAVMNDDRERAEQLARDMYPGERARLLRQLVEAAEIVARLDLREG